MFELSACLGWMRSEGLHGFVLQTQDQSWLRSAKYVGSLDAEGVHERLQAAVAGFGRRPQICYQTANLVAEAGHDQWRHPAGADAEPIPELEFDQTLGL